MQEEMMGAQIKEVRVNAQTDTLFSDRNRPEGRVKKQKHDPYFKGEGS